MKAKTISIMIGLILFLGFKVNAQNFKFGILAGFDVANAHLANKPHIEGDSRVYYPMVSFNANGYVGFKSDDFWGLSVEPGFIQKGGVQLYDKDKKDDNVRFQLNYLQIPILVDIYFSDKMFLSFGSEFAYLINAKAKSKDNSNDITDLYDKRFELSGLIGINYQLAERVDIGLRYNHGLTYSSKISWSDAMGNQLGDSKEYNQYVQLIVRFKL